MDFSFFVVASIEDISLGRMIGEMWDKQIGGNHSYFNCNTSKNRKKYKYDALGVINRDDQTKIGRAHV